MQDANVCYAALKLIEQLNRDELIPDYIFTNILNDYSAIVDVSDFTVTKVKKEEKQKLCMQQNSENAA